MIVNEVIDSNEVLKDMIGRSWDGSTPSPMILGPSFPARRARTKPCPKGC